MLHLKTGQQRLLLGLVLLLNTLVMVAVVFSLIGFCMVTGYVIPYFPVVRSWTIPIHRPVVEVGRLLSNNQSAIA